MDRDEYQKLKAEIIAKYGVPEYDNYTPVNESAQRIQALKGHYVGSAKKETKKQVAIQTLAKELKKDGRFVSYTVEVDDSYLLNFSEKEQAIIRLKFSNFNLTNREVAIKLGVSTQSVTALLNSPGFKILSAKVFDQLLPFESLQCLLSAVKQGDSKIAERLLEHFGYLKPSETNLNLTNKPITDPKAIELLKQLGDKLSNPDIK